MTVLQIMTNNPMVRERFTHYPLTFHFGYLQVLVAARDAIHQGSRLLMHPDSGNLKPGQTPYRSLLLDKQNPQLDISSLKMIENAITRYHSLVGKQNLISHSDESMLSDYQLVDFILLSQAINTSDKSAFVVPP